MYREGFYCFMFVVCGLMLTFRKRGNLDSKKAIFFFIMIYFSTEIPFRLGYAPPRPYIYAVLAGVSSILICLYQSLDVTRLILAAWAMEIILVGMNIVAFRDINTLSGNYSDTLGIINYISFILLTWNWLNGSSVIYQRLWHIDFDGVAAYYRRIAMAKEKN